MNSLPNQPEAHDVTTDLGVVRVLTWENASPLTPVVLIPGMYSGAVMWAENIAHLLGQRTVLAVDSLGDAGFSTQRVPMRCFEDQGAWLGQLVENLGMQRVHLVGHSFGGTTAAALALCNPGQVASLTLIEPVMVVHPLPASAFMWGTVAKLPVSRSLSDWALSKLGGVESEDTRSGPPLAALIKQATSHFNAVMPTPRKLTDQEWENMHVPIRLDIAETSLAGGNKASDRMTQLRSDASVKVWPGTTHSLPMQEAEQLSAELSVFWERHDPSD